MTFKMPSQFLKLTQALIFTLLAVLLLILIVLAVQSLRWPMIHDAPPMMYYAFAVEHYGMVPYRDLFEFNLPTTYAFAILVGKLTDYSDFGFRVADIAYLALILSVTYLWMKQFGRLVGVAACVLFGARYLLHGPSLSLEREEILLLPVAIAGFITSLSVRWSMRTRALAIGFIFGICAGIKPHALLGLPAMILALYFELRTQDTDLSFRHQLITFLKCCLFGLLGLLLPLIAMAAYILLSGGLPRLLEVYRVYLPLYADVGLVGSDPMLIPPDQRWSYTLSRYFEFGGQIHWIVFAVIGGSFALNFSSLSNVTKRQVLLLAGLALSYSFYPVATRQFFFYHWIPLTYFLLLLSALCFVAYPDLRRRWQVWLSAPVLVIKAALAVVIVFMVSALWGYMQKEAWRSVSDRPYTVATEVADFLQSHLTAQDTVQPLDATGGVLRGILQAKARIATPFTVDVFFYIHVSNPAIQNLRQQFIEQLTAAKPRFIVQAKDDYKVWVKGEDTTHDFPALHELLTNQYHVAHEGADYLIYERD